MMTKKHSSIVLLFSIIYFSLTNFSFCQAISKDVLNCPVSNLKYFDKTSKKIFITESYSEKWIKIDSSEYGSWTLRGVIDGKTVYLSYSVIKAAPCCGFTSDTKYTASNKKWIKGPLLKNIRRWGGSADVSAASLTISDIDEYGFGPLKGFTLVPISCQKSSEPILVPSSQQKPSDYMANTSKSSQISAMPYDKEVFYRWQSGFAMGGTLVGTIENSKGSKLRLSCSAGIQEKTANLYYEQNTMPLQDNEKIQIVVDNNAYHFNLSIIKDSKTMVAEISTLGSRMEFGKLSYALSSSSVKEFTVEFPRLSIVEPFSLKDAHKVLKDELKGKVGTIVDQCL